MNLLRKLLAARDVISAGETVANPKTWSNLTSCVGALLILFNAAKAFVPQLENFDENTFRQIAEGLFYLWSVVAVFVLPATVKDAGLPTKRRKE